MSKLSRSLVRMKEVIAALQPFASERRAVARRSLLWRALRHEAAVITFERHGVHWSGPVRSAITQALFTAGDYQHAAMPPLFAWLARQRPAWSERWHIVNVGANIGDTAIALALRTGKQVLACEPVPELHDLLRRNIAANGLSGQVEAVPMAVAATCGEAEIICPREPEYAEMRGSAGTQGFPHAAHECQTFVVPTITLDGLLARQRIAAPEVALVWSDTQGFESEVIASGASLWRAGVPLWVEVWPRGLAAHGGVDHFLALCRQHFRTFLTEDQLLAQGAASAAQAVAGLEPLVRALRGRAFTDVLLIPENQA